MKFYFEWHERVHKSKYGETVYLKEIEKPKKGWDRQSKRMKTDEKKDTHKHRETEIRLRMLKHFKEKSQMNIIKR